MEEHQLNPFFFGPPVSPQYFINRKPLVKQIARRFFTEGQSTAITGDPRIGKTSILKYISDPQTRSQLYGAAGDHMIFSFLDSHMLVYGFTSSQFWKQVLSPLRERVIDTYLNLELATQYQNCSECGFDNFSVERLFISLDQTQWKLILLIDEFDVLIHHQSLNDTGFFLELRSLSSLRSSLALVIASRQPLHQLQSQIPSSGSPSLNTIIESNPGPFPQKDVDLLLSQADDRFSPADKEVIQRLSGRHPYLLQVAGSALWDAYEDEEITTPQQRWTIMTEQLFREHSRQFSETWNFWSPETRKVFATVALCTPTLVFLDKDARLDPAILDPSIEELNFLQSELSDLAYAGTIVSDPINRSGWRVEAEAMTGWLKDELIRNAREEQQFNQWLQRQELDNLFKKREKENLSQIRRFLVDLSKQGAKKFVDTFVETVTKRLLSGSDQ